MRISERAKQTKGTSEEKSKIPARLTILVLVFQ